MSKCIHRFAFLSTPSFSQNRCLIYVNRKILPLVLNFTSAGQAEANYIGRAVCLRSLERWDLGFESYWRHGCLYCVRLFCVCVDLYVGSGLETGWSPVQGVLPTAYRVKKLKKKKTPRSNKALYCHRWMDGWMDGRTTDRQAEQNCIQLSFLTHVLLSLNNLSTYPLVIPLR
jgi:hypothetical protein